MEAAEDVARAIGSATGLIIVGVYSVLRMLEQLGFRPKSSQPTVTGYQAVESLARSLEVSVKTLRSTTRRIDSVVDNVAQLSKGLQTWQKPVVEHLERIEQLMVKQRGARSSKR